MAVYHRLKSRWSNTPAAFQSRQDVNPTLIVSWFCTIMSLTIILIRLFGRWVRTERLFREDKVMVVSIIPLFIRMAFVHVVLIWGTNNTTTAGLSLEDIRHREIGSKLVLIARIFYAAYIWIAKVAVMEFTRRIISQTQTRLYDIVSRIIYGFLALAFAAVVVATLAECRPFHHYWQVVPDPGAACRTGGAQLVTMGTCDMVTDLVLIIFPIPLLWRSNMRLMKKISMILLFLLSLILIAITAYRIPSTIERRFSQQYRSLLASLEILAATCVSNMIVIGSFLRDKGVRKAKFRAGSVDGSALDPGNNLTLSRTKSMMTAQAHWGSDEDLVRDMGLAVTPSLRHNSVVEQTARLAQPAEPAPNNHLEPVREDHGQRQSIGEGWTFQNGAGSRQRRWSGSSSDSSNASDLKLQIPAVNEPVSPGDSAVTPGRTGFFDVGGLMSDDDAELPEVPTPVQLSSQVQMHSISKSKAFLSDVGGLFGSKSKDDDEIRPVPPVTGSPSLFPDRREGQHRGRSRSPFARLSGSHRGTPSQSRLRKSIDPVPQDTADPDALDISDAGGLLK